MELSSCDSFAGGCKNLLNSIWDWLSTSNFYWNAGKSGSADLISRSAALSLFKLPTADSKTESALHSLPNARWCGGALKTGGGQANFYWNAGERRQVRPSAVSLAGDVTEVKRARTKDSTVKARERRWSGYVLLDFFPPLTPKGFAEGVAHAVRDGKEFTVAVELNGLVRLYLGLRSSARMPPGVPRLPV